VLDKRFFVLRKLSQISQFDRKKANAQKASNFTPKFKFEFGLRNANIKVIRDVTGFTNQQNLNSMTHTNK